MHKVQTVTHDRLINNNSNPFMPDVPLPSGSTPQNS